ncbi:hypothetical protein LZ32DRAFT_332202 [Colletotrichum eremochloae]|nr:hypothetical protein LZ32DRAFT_332202 [Colletotrichum eremochloae]
MHCHLRHSPRFQSIGARAAATLSLSLSLSSFRGLRHAGQDTHTQLDAGIKQNELNKKSAEVTTWTLRGSSGCSPPVRNVECMTNWGARRLGDLFPSTSDSKRWNCPPPPPAEQFRTRSSLPRFWIGQYPKDSSGTKPHCRLIWHVRWTDGSVSTRTVSAAWGFPDLIDPALPTDLRDVYAVGQCGV